jgi:hypothetical protein
MAMLPCSSDDSFALRNAFMHVVSQSLTDGHRFVKRAKEAEEVAEAYAQQPSKDYSLKPGEKITIKLDIPKKVSDPQNGMARKILSRGQ